MGLGVAGRTGGVVFGMGGSDDGGGFPSSGQRMVRGFLLCVFILRYHVVGFVGNGGRRFLFCFPFGGTRAELPGQRSFYAGRVRGVAGFIHRAFVDQVILFRKL